MDLINFAYNLSLTCEKKIDIRGDGKSLNIFDRISDFFHGRSKHEHFLSVCYLCSQSVHLEKIESLSEEKQIKILGRMREIQKKIKNQGIKNRCDFYINKIETDISSKNLENYADALFKDILQNANNGKLQLNDHVKNLEELIKIFGNNEESIAKISLKFICFFYETQSSPEGNKKRVFQEINERFCEILISQEKKILESGNASSDDYHLYSVLFGINLKNSYEKKDEKKICNSIFCLKSLMELNLNNPIFIENCLEQVNDFLQHYFFHSNENISLSEMNKDNLLFFKDFFDVVDDYLPFIRDENSKLIMSLKIKFANLPTRRKRTDFNNLFLSEKDQVKYLEKKLQKKEDEMTDILSLLLKIDGFFVTDVKKLAKLASAKSDLSNENRLKIRSALEISLKENCPENWEDYRDVKALLENISLLKEEKISYVENLKKTCKSKAFFSNQLDLDEDMIHIPRWYHTTNSVGVDGIIDLEEIQVRHERNFKGAWVSTERENAFGDYTFSFNNKIVDPNKKIVIGFEHCDRRWRGLQQSIPLKTEENISHLVGIGVSSNLSKNRRKIDKLKLIANLKSIGFQDVKVMSSEQLDFMQKEVKAILGAPNLPIHWWGSGLFTRVI